MRAFLALIILVIIIQVGWVWWNWHQQDRELERAWQKVYWETDLE